MNFTQKVYYNNKPILVTNSREILIGVHTAAASYPYTGVEDKPDFERILDLLNSENVQGAVIQDDTANGLLEHIKSVFTIIVAGGGVVYNAKKEILMIYRRNKWDLPKGKLDAGETISECALREVEEETGVAGLSLGDKLCDTYHIYNEKGKHILKHTVWYKMHTDYSAELVPQPEEDIQQAKWVDTGNLFPYMSNTYEGIKDVLHTAGCSW